MAENKSNQMNDSKGSMGSSSDREFESQGKNPSSGKSGHGQEAGGYGKGTGSQGNMEDDEMNTAGGRQGQFSDSQGGQKGQWSPGSKQSSDQ